MLYSYINIIYIKRLTDYVGSWFEPDVRNFLES